MRVKTTLVSLAAAVLVLMLGPGSSPGRADMMVLEHNDIFGDLRRPPVPFDHELHMDALDEPGCGACHHSWDNAAGKLVYVEGEEFSCFECHLTDKTDGTPALRQAYHGSCNVCHRQLIKAAQSPSGPTTCGECHPRPDR